jgi:hypothetical protein
VNIYAYVGGDPVNKRDPSGLCGYRKVEFSWYRLNEDGSVGEHLGPAGSENVRISCGGGGGGFSHRNLPIGGPDGCGGPLGLAGALRCGNFGGGAGFAPSPAADAPGEGDDEDAYCRKKRLDADTAARNLSGGAAFVRAWRNRDAQALEGYRVNAADNAELSRKFNTVVGYGSWFAGGAGLGLRLAGKALPLAADLAGVGAGTAGTFGYAELAEFYDRRADNIATGIDYFEAINAGKCVGR